jgi:hypothetical protein
MKTNNHRNSENRQQPSSGFGLRVSAFGFRAFASITLAVPILSAPSIALQAAADQPSSGPVKVQIRHEDDGRYHLYVDNKPFYIKGAGLEFGSPEKLAEHGGNAFRTWRTENGRRSGQQVLDSAQRNGLYVAMGLDIARERHGFDYNDPARVARQLESIKAEVLKYKDHPALIIWIIGNELNLRATNPKVWQAVNDISKMIHQVDPNHLTMTALAGISRPLITEIKSNAPDLDLLGIQMYADIMRLPQALKDSGWTGPYLVTEWGATGHWEVGKTAWGAPIENDSTTKADYYLKRYQTAIESDHSQCVGSFVFLWGQKQERTPTWYGLFLETGEKTPAVDVMHYIWQSRWPDHRCPKIEGAWLDGRTAQENIRLKPGKSYIAKISVRAEDELPIIYRWEVLEESRDLKDGGDPESKPRAVPGTIARPGKAEITLHAPSKPGAYRLFAYAFDGKGGAAHVNIPFLVEAPTEVSINKQDK